MRRFRCLCASFWLAGSLTVSAQNFDAAAASAKTDLDKALAELSALRQQIAAEKLPLAKKYNALEDQLFAKRKEFDRIQRLRGSKVFDLDSLRAEVKSRKDENIYVTTLLDEYLRSFETRIHISEVQRYKDTLAAAKIALEDVNLTAAQKFAQQIAVVKSSLTRIEALTGGEIFPGYALSTGGKAEPGKFAMVGPVVMFASDNGAVAGTVELQLGSPEPTIIEIGKDAATAIRQVVQAGKGELPVDASLGSAVRIAGTKETLWQHIRKGGPVMVPIFLLAIVAFSIVVVKWVEIAKYPAAQPEDLQKVLQHLNRGETAPALQVAASVKGPTGGLLKAGIENLGKPKELVEEVMYEQLLSVKPRLERWLPFVAVTAATEPLLGLLGTVTGIINTFKLITVFGTGDPKLLSSGISEALITTEFGLFCAIPALLLHALLSRRVRGLLASYEQTVVGFINGMPHKG
jgi:biopolymer transport protein ExbB